MQHECVIENTRIFAFAPPTVFAAMANPDLLQRWWGPAGFRNSFRQFDFRVGGRWLLTMHGPDGTDYPNEWTFVAIEPDAGLVIRHDVEPLFTLMITLAPAAAGTHVTWHMVFDAAATRQALVAVCAPANEENFERLQQLLQAHSATLNEESAP